MVLDNLPVLRPFLRAGKRFAFGALADVVLREWNIGSWPSLCTCGLHGVNAAESRPSLEKPLIFVYRSGYRALGSVRLRVWQLASAMKAKVANPGFVKVVTEDHPLLDAAGALDVVWSKTAITGYSGGAIRKIADKGGRVLLDFVDGTDVPELSGYAHGYLCASRTELAYRISLGHKAWYVPHAVDQRIQPAGFERQNFSVGYFGRPWMVEHVEALSRVAAVPAQESFSDKQFRDALLNVSKWSHHYSVRSYFGESNFKPPTKVFLAARLGSVFIGSRADEEVALLLGSDYPYLSKDSSYQEVRKIIEFAQESFLEEDWVRAKSAMEDARQECCDEAIAERLLSILAGLD